MRGRSRTVYEQLANGQHGVVSRAQLLDAGVGADAIDRRLQSGILLRVHPGVYRVGHRAPSVEAAYLAAVLACGPRALLSGRAAAHLYSLVRGPAPPPEVTACTERRIEGVVTRRTRTFDERDATRFDGIPVTTVARTLADLAGNLSEDALARVCHEAHVLHRTTPAQIEEVLSRRPSTKGARTLRRVVHGDVPVALSVLERRFLNLLEENGIPLPMTNRRAGSKRVDCRWPEHRLTVELDGYRYHASRHAWEQDRRREREARARGDDFRRFTYGDVYERPGVMLRELRVVFAGRPA